MNTFTGPFLGYEMSSELEIYYFAMKSIGCLKRRGVGES